MMTALFFKLLGGIGLFLMGMVLLTDGLKAFAGEALRRALLRFTGTPLKAFSSGAIVTAMVQSSSATTVTVIGFVSAGLLSFPQAVGVVMGASFGTTGTSWIVSVLGLKVSLGFYALPFVGIGAFLKLLAVGRWKSLGVALAGFGLIFIGIETLQEGMQGLSGFFKLSEIPSEGFWSHVLGIFIGATMTVIMQSSSAAVATTLTALHTGTINFEQSTSLLIGAAIGTTVTGALAAIGGSVSAKRTALAHVLFNSLTGLIAMLLLPLFLYGIVWAQEYIGLEPGAMSLAAFHTSFILLGVIVFFPFIDRFSNFIQRVLPEKGPLLTRNLDDTILSIPSVALETSRRTLQEISVFLIQAILEILSGASRKTNYVELDRALDETQDFFARIPPVAEDEPLSQRRIFQVHGIDHMLRLKRRLLASEELKKGFSQSELQDIVHNCRKLLEFSISGLSGEEKENWLAELEYMVKNFIDLCQKQRPLFLQRSNQWGTGKVLLLLDALRWMERVIYHLWKTCYYLKFEEGMLQSKDGPEET